MQDDGKEDERSAGDHTGEPKFMNQDINANINMNQCSPKFFALIPSQLQDINIKVTDIKN